MEEETKKLRNLRKEREWELTNRHTRELEEFDVIEDEESSSTSPWKHRTSSQRTETNNGAAVNGRKSSASSSPIGSTER